MTAIVPFLRLRPSALGVVVGLAVACGSPTAGVDGGAALDAGAEVDGGPCDVDVAADPNNCGACGHVCPHRPGTTAACTAGECRYACVEDFDDCNGEPSDGCEADTRSDASHCGTCDNVCPASLPHASGVCEGSSCAVGCASGWADCDHDLLSEGSDGCEVDVSSDAANCGSCGNACPGACTGGTCEGVELPCAFFLDRIEHPVAVSVASDGTGFFVAWTDLSSHALFAASLDANARELGASVEVASVDSWDRFAVAFDGTHYALVWETGETNEIWAARYDSMLREVGVRGVVSAGDPNGIFAHGADGEVIVAFDGAGMWIGPGAPRSAGAVGEFATKIAPFGAGYLSIGSRTIAPSPERPYEHYGVEWVSFDASLERGTESILDPALSLSQAWATGLASTGGGAVLAVLGEFTSLSSPVLHTAAFDATGSPIGAPTWQTPIGSTQPVDTIGLAPDTDRVWLAYRASSDSEVAIRLLALDTMGRAIGTPAVIARPRDGFIGAPALAASDSGVLVMWDWRSFSGGADLHAIEGAFMRRDGNVARPCD